ncbi:MAG: hypothetical protein GX259_01750 [Bacteroidales bacterium]|nr:hypothetical protein [Bacteroidales bacterium]
MRNRLFLVDIAYAIQILFSSFKSSALFAVVALLMPVNLYFEAMKWKKVASTVLEISLKRAYIAVLAGLSTGFILPNRIGEFAGKAMSLSKSEFWKGSVLAIFTSLTQLLITLLCGFCGIIYFAKYLNSCLGFKVFLLVFILSAISVFLIVFLYFNVQYLPVFFRKLKRVYETISVLKSISFKIKLKLLFLSFFRYFVFCGQNLLMLFLLDVNIPIIDAFFLLSLMYLILAAFPVFILTDLPIRVSALLVLVSAWFEINNIALPYGIEAKLIILSFVIWLINIVLPAIFGVLAINKFFISKKDK